MLTLEKIKEDFPQVGEIYADNKPIIYLDSAATNLKLKAVIDSTLTYYAKECANVHRGIHTLSEISTAKYENTRTLLKDFLGANQREEIVFTRGTTEAINLVASSWGNQNIKEGDEILISHMEHHSNIVPWQMLCERKKAHLKVIPINDQGEILFEEYLKLLTPQTKLVSVTYISNALGTINPIAKMISEAHKVSAKFLVDAAQAAAHLSCNVQKLNCDFLAISAHKMFGPTGIGALYAKIDLLKAMSPIQGGGDMIDTVSFEKTTYAAPPQKFEAGTPNIAGAIAWAPAIEYINKLGLSNIEKYEQELLTYATEKLSSIKDLTIIGRAKSKGAVISFTIDNIHSHDIATIANKYHIAIRTGHHCTQPLMRRMNVTATARASLSIYNTKEDINQLYRALQNIIKLFL